jgi:hypothetical protein
MLWAGCGCSSFSLHPSLRPALPPPPRPLPRTRSSLFVPESGARGPLPPAPRLRIALISIRKIELETDAGDWKKFWSLDVEVEPGAPEILTPLPTAVRRAAFHVIHHCQLTGYLTRQAQSQRCRFSCSVPLFVRQFFFESLSFFGLFDAESPVTFLRTSQGAESRSLARSWVTCGGFSSAS